MAGLRRKAVAGSSPATGCGKLSAFFRKAAVNAEDAPKPQAKRRRRLPKAPAGTEGAEQKTEAAEVAASEPPKACGRGRRGRKAAADAPESAPTAEPAASPVPAPRGKARAKGKAKAKGKARAKAEAGAKDGAAAPVTDRPKVRAKDHPRAQSERADVGAAASYPIVGEDIRERVKQLPEATPADKICVTSVSMGYKLYFDEKYKKTSVESYISNFQLLFRRDKRSFAAMATHEYYQLVKASTSNKKHHGIESAAMLHFGKFYAARAAECGGEFKVNPKWGALLYNPGARTLPLVFKRREPAPGNPLFPRPGGSSAAGGDEEMVEVSQRVPIVDPISLCRIENPVRGRNCSHLQAFDREPYIEFNQMMEKGRNRLSKLWNCPFCGNPVKEKDLVVAEAFVNVLVAAKSLPAITHVNSMPDGSLALPTDIDDVDEHGDGSSSDEEEGQTVTAPKPASTDLRSFFQSPAPRSGGEASGAKSSAEGPEDRPSDGEVLQESAAVAAPADEGVGAPKPEGFEAAPPKPEDVEAASPKLDGAEAASPKSEVAEVAPPKSEVAEAALPKSEVAEAASPMLEDAEAASPKPEVAGAASPKSEGAEAASPKPEGTEAASSKPEGAEATSTKPEGGEAGPPQPGSVEAAPPKPEGSEAAPPKPEGSEAASPKPEGAEGSPPKPDGAEAVPMEPEGVEALPAKPEDSDAVAPKPEGTEAAAQDGEMQGVAEEPSGPGQEGQPGSARAAGEVAASDEASTVGLPAGEEAQADPATPPEAPAPSKRRRVKKDDDASEERSPVSGGAGASSFSRDKPSPKNCKLPAPVQRASPAAKAAAKGCGDKLAPAQPELEAMQRNFLQALEGLGSLAFSRPCSSH